eukprot:1155337-Pelagomonas_calceolata.AAC.4
MLQSAGSQCDKDLAGLVDDIADLNMAQSQEGPLAQGRFDFVLTVMVYLHVVYLTITLHLETPLRHPAIAVNSFSQKF